VGRGWVRRRGNGKYVGVSGKRIRYFTPTLMVSCFYNFPKDSSILGLTQMGIHSLGLFLVYDLKGTGHLYVIEKYSCRVVEGSSEKVNRTLLNKNNKL
jgi:hypothetical protein